MMLGDRLRDNAHYVRTESRALWYADPKWCKVRAIVRGRWVPSVELMRAQAVATLKIANVI